MLWLTALPAWAVEYRLQVANIDDETFASYEGKARSWTDMKEPMGRLEARLDDNHFSRAAILPGHHVELVQDPAYGGVTPTKVSRLPATRDQDWSTYVFDANPGDTVVFVMRPDMYAWEQAEDVASDVKGTFRRLSIGGPGFFGGSREVPQVSQDFLANAATAARSRSGWRSTPNPSMACPSWSGRGTARQMTRTGSTSSSSCPPSRTRSTW